MTAPPVRASKPLADYVPMKHTAGGPMTVYLPGEIATRVRRVADATGTFPTALIIDILRDTLSRLEQP